MQVANTTKHEMPGWISDVLLINDIKNLTTIQCLAVEAGVAQYENLVICAPTSSGKTLVGEIALLSAIKDNNKVLYLVSHKALAEQKYEDFTLKYGKNSPSHITEISISTGDREEGHPEASVQITTYEKAISLLHSGSLNLSETVIIADELQIIGDNSRGAEIELLCAAIRQRKPRQFIALTATVENGQELADWLESKLVKTTDRDIDLIQEIWFENKVYTLKFGAEQGVTQASIGRQPNTTLDAVEQLLSRNLGPILVFTETRKDAMNLAESYSARRAKTSNGYIFAEQLSLFSEATEFSEKLKTSSESNIVFHTADLTQSERLVIEQALVKSEFDVCFATPTLAAGVNFPFRTVVFDRVIRQYIDPKKLPVGDYRNMSGRAGRLGMHENGYSIIIPRDRVEAAHANILISPQNEILASKLSSLSARKIVLSLVASGSGTTKRDIQELLKNTLFWHQVQERNPVKLVDLLEKIDHATEWLSQHDMLLIDADRLIITDLGLATAKSGLQPSSAFELSRLLKNNAARLDEGFEDFEIGIIHAAISCDEFTGEPPQRFLPYATSRSTATRTLLQESTLLRKIDSYPIAERVNLSTHAIYLFISGELERKISSQTGVSAGQIHRLAQDTAWILEGLHKIASLPSIGCSQPTMNAISILSQRVRTGSPVVTLDVIKIAHRARVPGFGRQRALALMRAGFSDTASILSADKVALAKLLSSEERMVKLIAALENSEDRPYDRARWKNIKLSSELGIEKLVKDSYELLGNEYEDPIESLLRLIPDLIVTKLDDGKRQGTPDFMIGYKEMSAVLECKTCTKKPPTITKDEAFAVLTKAANIDRAVHRITLGKPGFDTFSESKACGAADITLINHSVFIEGVLLVISKEVSSESFYRWLVQPGVSEVERLLNS